MENGLIMDIGKNISVVRAPYKGGNMKCPKMNLKEDFNM